MLECKVHSAGIPDVVGAKEVLMECKNKYPRMEVVFADGAYQGENLEKWVGEQLNWRVEVVKKLPGPGFKVLRKRWVVERTFGWLGKWRRLAKEYEYLTIVSEAMVYVASVRILLSRLMRSGKPIREKRKKAQVQLIV